MNRIVSTVNQSNFPAACVLAAGLVIAALIMTHRPPTNATGAAPVAITTGAAPTRSVVSPPITQTSAGQQVRAQILAEPSLHMYRHGGVTYTLKDLEITKVVYSAKDDTFVISYAWDWQPTLSDDLQRDNEATLTNDGYGNYTGSAGINNNEVYAAISIK